MAIFMRPFGAFEQWNSRGQSDLRHNDSAEPFSDLFHWRVQDPIQGTYNLYVWGTRLDPASVFRGLCPLVPPKLDVMFTVVDTVMCIIIENILDTWHQFCRAVILRVVRGVWVYGRSVAGLWFTVGEMASSAWLDAFLSDRKQLLFWRTLRRLEES